jgi:2-succinyl-5-enolpyruvyl-6-hydroxy-3-cyclohexene-1-carboxylate synthase
MLFPSSPRAIRIEANRGANGIDGFLSTGLGDAAVSGEPTYLLAGDLSALHDLTALGTAARHDIPATIVLLNNDGGGIFHLLPQRGLPEFERHFATPHGTDFLAAAAALGVPAHRVETFGELAAEVAGVPTGPRLLEVRTERDETAAALSRIRDAAAAAAASVEL